MRNILLVLNIVISFIIVALILLQGKGAGLGGAWGGGGELYQTRRGVEKLTMRATIASIILFFVVSIVALFVK